MVHRIRYGMLALVVACTAVPVGAQTSAQEVRVLLEKRDRDIKEAVRKLDSDTHTQQDRDNASSLINDQIDFQEMGRLALGKYWEDISTKDREEFVNVFGFIVRAQSLSDLAVYNAAVTFEAVDVKEEKAYVRITANVDDTPLKVEYKLRQKEDAWWLYDIVIDDVGTVEGYAISFQSYIRKRGFEKFMASLVKKRNRLQAES